MRNQHGKESVSAAWYFTAPWEPVPVRRGDALGFRAGADYFAELLAPGLSNGTSDARWISILSWCLKWSHIAWQSAGGDDLSRREDQRARYAWLRPLELLWVARTLKSGQNTGQLRGRRSIERWFKSDLTPLDFAMSPDQFRRYRQVGMYGAYRVVFRTVSGLTTGDGWTPSVTAIELAKLVNNNLPHGARLKQENFESCTNWRRWRGGNETRYWVEHGWQEWAKVGDFLPTPDDSVRNQLPEKERQLIESVLFPHDSIRRITAKVLASAKAAQTHAELCDALARSEQLSKVLGPASLASLPAFTGIADAAMHAMRGLWYAINHGDAEQARTVDQIADSQELQLRFEQLCNAGDTWLKAHGRSDFPHEQTVTRLAEAMKKAKTLPDRIRALAKHHDEYGGGRRWFREQTGKLVPLVADTGIAASNYRFRLRSLCLLATQCGVAKVDKALDAMDKEGSEEDEKDYK